MRATRRRQILRRCRVQGRHGSGPPPLPSSSRASDPVSSFFLWCYFYNISLLPFLLLLWFCFFFASGGRTWLFLFLSSLRLTMSSSFLCPPLLLHRSWLAPSPWCHCLLYQQTASTTDILYFLYSKPFRVQIRTPVTWTIFKESPSGQGLAEQTRTPPSPILASSLRWTGRRSRSQAPLSSPTFLPRRPPLQ